MYYNNITIIVLSPYYSLYGYKGVTPIDYGSNTLWDTTIG